MTVQTTDNKAEYTADGVLVEYVFNFKTFAISHIEVYLDGDIQSTGFTTVLYVDQETTPGGTVTFDTAPADGVLVTILRVVPLTQLIDYQAYDPFPADTHERALDLSTMVSQQQQEAIDRNSQSIGSEPGVDTTWPPYDAGKGIKWSINDPKRLVNTDNDIDAAASQAAASAAAAATSETNAAASEDKANKWAEEAEDVEVETGEYSAYHWAQKALLNAGPGEANTGLNIGTGEGIYTTNAGVQLQLKSLKAGGTASISSNADSITVTGTGIADAPSDGNQYARKDGAWDVVASPVAVPTGAIVAWPLAGSAAGYLLCNGQAVSRTTYAALFAAIGVAYGNGDGSTTFNVPDYRGYFLRGTDNGAGIDPDAASRTDRGDGATGDNVGTKQTDQYKTHSHSGSTSSEGSHSHNVTAAISGNGNARGGESGDAVDGTRTTNSRGDHTHSVSIGSSGGNETRPKNININWLIKT